MVDLGLGFFFFWTIMFWSILKSITCWENYQIPVLFYYNALFFKKRKSLFLGGIRPIRSSRAAVPGDVTAEESTDWLQLLWTLVASLVAPEDEEEGIHQLTETFTCKKTSSHSPFNEEDELILWISCQPCLTSSSGHFSCTEIMY